VTVNDTFMVQDSPDPESLRCFLAALRAPTFRAAAREVALTPAALGQRIKLLEDRLGVALFSRTTRKVTPTEAALALGPAAERALTALHDCVRAARGEGERARVELVIGTRDELGRSWLVPQLGALRAAMPWLRIHLYFGQGNDLLHRVRAAEIDAAITSTRFADPRLTALVLHEEEYVFVGARTLLRKTPLRRAEDALKHTLLDAGADLPLFRYFREGEGAPDLRFAEVLRLGAIGPIAHEVLRGAGVAVLPKYFTAADRKKGRLVPLFPHVKLGSDHFRLVLRAADPRRTLFDALAAELRKAPLR
jgi:DNA-binding transcriptional LysR family regulator